MSVHDWSRVRDNEFHDFHNTWIANIRSKLNQGILPPNYLARCEQKYGTPIADVLTLFRPEPPNGETNGHYAPTGESGGVAVAVAPPMKTAKIDPPMGYRNRAVVIRREGDESPVAIIEVVSRSNKDGPAKLADFVEKVSATLTAGIHVVLLDILPPNDHTLGGLHAAIAAGMGQPVEESSEAWQPADRPIALLSYRADRPGAQVYFDFLAVGSAFPALPLFLSYELLVPLPLTETYAETFCGTAGVTRRRLEG